MLTTKITNIADAIRNKTNTTDKMTLEEMPSKIETIITEPMLQDKSITITENGTTNIIADNGYYGLNNVEVVTNVASSGGNVPEVGFIVNEWNNMGYPTDMTIVGMSTIPLQYFRGLCMGKYLTKVEIQDEITNIGTYSFNGCTNLVDLIFKKGSNFSISDYAFTGCTKLKNVNFKDITINSGTGKYVFQNCSSMLMDEFPSGLITQYIGYDYMYDGCTSINFKRIPDGIIGLNSICMFGRCTGLTQLSLNIKTIIGNSYNNSAFKDCTGLKALWIGSKISTSGFAQYSFAGCTGITKMFIDKPRATVEAMTNYSNKFGATNAQIICNDDAEFMTREEFDAIDWATYTM